MFGFVGKMIGSAIGKFAGKVFGDAATQAMTVVTKVVDTSGNVVSQAVNDPKDLAEARKFAAPSAQGGGYIRQLADGLNCLIRPALAIWLGLIVGRVIEAPDVSQLPSEYAGWFETVMVFYFGQRALVHDVPRLLRNVRAALGK